MKLVQVPFKYESRWLAETDLGDWDIEKIEKIGADLGAYWYKTGSYEGAGQLLFRVKEKWFLHDCGHCSCYGPTEHISINSGYDTLEDVLASCSEEYRKEVEPLVDALRVELKEGA